jgi:endonuclease YncB( thermonuclease family)
MTKNYSKMLQELRAIKAETEQKVQSSMNTILAEAYWRMGQRITREKLQKSEQPLILKQLAQDLAMEETMLTRCIKFYSLFAGECPAAKYPFVTWSHYKLLLSMPDKNQRLFYLIKTQKYNWTVRKLSQHVKNNAFAKDQKASESGSQRPVLSPKPEALHIYKAQLDYIVDGDTLVADIDLGFDVWVKKRLRLRGINTPEMNSKDQTVLQQAQKAKAFAQERMVPRETIVLQTFQVDLHGRFICDVYYLTGEKNKETIYKEGNFLNQELLDAGLAELV